MYRIKDFSGNSGKKGRRGVYWNNKVVHNDYNCGRGIQLNTLMVRNVYKCNKTIQWLIVVSSQW